MSNNAILLTTHNGEQYLRELLESLFSQSVSDFVVYVHDDGSKDSTKGILAEYEAKYNERFVILNGPVCGSAMSNFMWMLGQVEADYYLFCDQDDVWFSDKVEKDLAKIAEASSPVACVFSDMLVVDAVLNKLSDSFISYIGRSPRNISYTQILIDNPAAGCTMCISRALRDIAIGEYGIDFSFIPMHDAFILELAAVFGQILYIDEPLIYYRQTGHNEMGATTESIEKKLVRNVSDIGGGSFLARKKAFIKEARLFARELVKIKEIPDDKYAVLSQFAEIEKQNKFRRMAFYKKNNFKRAKHNLWMRLWV